MPSANDVEVEGRLGQLEWHARATEARLGAAEQRIEATGQLAGQLDGFAASVAEYSARLDQQNLTHQKAIETLANKFEEKLEIIGAAFDDCNRKLKELQQAVYAAPAVGPAAPPGMPEASSLALLRGRLDELAREALTSSSRHKELEERVVALDLAVREGHADLADRLARGVSAGQADAAQRFAHVSQQLTGLEQRLAAGTCK